MKFLQKLPQRAPATRLRQAARGGQTKRAPAALCRLRALLEAHKPGRPLTYTSRQERGRHRNSQGEEHPELGASPLRPGDLAENSTVSPASFKGIQAGGAQLGSEMALGQAAEGVVRQGGHTEAGPHQPLQLSDHMLHNSGRGGGVPVPAMVGGPDRMQPGGPQHGPQSQGPGL